MLCSRSRLCQSGPIFVIVSLILATGFIIQFHLLYKISLKNTRLKEYKADTVALSDTMDSVIKMANKTNNLLFKLERIVANRKAHRRKITHIRT